jgi:hypothetical protein
VICDKPGKNRRSCTHAVVWLGKESAARIRPVEANVYDLILAGLFFSVVLSPLAINACVNLSEKMALRREAAVLNKKAPRRAWSPEPVKPQTVSSVTPSVR